MAAKKPVTDQTIQENSLAAAEAIRVMDKMRKIPTVYPGHYFNFKFDNLKLTNVLRWEMSIFLQEPIEMFETSYRCSFILDPRPWEAQIESTIEDYKNPQGDLFTGYAQPDTYIEKILRIHSDYKKEAALFEHFDFDARLTKYDEKEYKSRKITLIIPDTLIQFFRTRKNDLNRFALLFRHESIVDDMYEEYSKNPADKIAEYLSSPDSDTMEAAWTASPGKSITITKKDAEKFAAVRSPLPPEKD